MRIIHTSDWHLGQELHEYSRGFEHDAFIDWLVGQICNRQADVVIVTGDLYDVANPPIEAQQRFYRFLREASEQSEHLQIVVIGGNHASAARVELKGACLTPARVFLIGALPRRNGQLDFERI